jgi:hypothetical protein
MARQGNEPQRGWYDEIMRGQYYDELIPAYEALQEEMAANSSSFFLICVRRLALLFTTLQALVRRAGPPPAAHRATSWRPSRTLDATEQIRVTNQLG